MKMKHSKRLVWLGVICTLLAAVSSWYTITFNDSRFIVPMEGAEYVFRAQDLPMLASGILLLLYILYLFIVLAGAIRANKRKEAAAQAARAVNPKLGF